MEVVVGELLGSVLVGENWRRFWMLSQVLNISGSVAPLQCGQIASTPVLSLPKQVLSKRLGEFGGEHVSPSCAW